MRNGLEARLRRGASADDDDDGDGRYPEIEKIVVLTGNKEPLFRVTVADHGDVVLPSRELHKYDLFNLRCLEQLLVVFRRVGQDGWSDRLSLALRHIEKEALPADETEEGMFFDALRAFCTDRHRAEVIEEVLLSKPFPDHEADRTYFRFADFRRFLMDHRLLSGASPNALGRMLNAIGQNGIDVGKTTKKLKKRITEMRWVRTSIFDGVGAESQIPLPPVEKPPV